jgi:virginiamycin B lyase
VAFILIGPTWLSATNPDGTRRLDDPNDFVRLEVERALRLGLLVCPLLLEGAAMPAVANLPPSIQEVHWHNALSIRSAEGEFAQDMARLAADIKQAVAGKGGTLVERFALVGRTTAIPLAGATGVAVGVAVAKTSALGDLFAKGCQTVAAKLVAVAAATVIVTTVTVAVVRPSLLPFSFGQRGAPIATVTRSVTAACPTGTITEFPIPLSTRVSGPESIVRGPDGNLWFTQAGGMGEYKIGRITPREVITEIPLPAGGAPQSITSGPDGNLWFLENVNQIGRITPGGVVTLFPVAGAGSGPDSITSGPDGNLWFTGIYGNQIGRITPDGVVTEFPVPIMPGAGGPEAITSGPDGNLWFTEHGATDIGRITPGGSAILFPDPTAQGSLASIASGPDGNLWFTEWGASQIGQITPAGAVTEFPMPDESVPRFITSGTDGNLWFTDSTPAGLGQIGQITPGGLVLQCPLPTATGNPYGITSGPDGVMWFTEYDADKIGRLAPP